MVNNNNNNIIKNTNKVNFNNQKTEYLNMSAA